MRKKGNEKQKTQENNKENFIRSYHLIPCCFSSAGRCSSGSTIGSCSVAFSLTADSSGGLDEGLDEGFEEGFEEGVDEGVDEGLEEGFEEGFVWAFGEGESRVDG